MRELIVPAGAIKVPLPLVRQQDDYFCGGGVFMSVASYFGVAPEELEDLKEALGADPARGTYYGNIVSYALKLGLSARVESGMSIERLKRLIDRRLPVMLSIQAYADDASVYEDPDSNLDGHYVGAVGYDRRKRLYFMDPSITGRYGLLSESDLAKRWHEDEGFEAPEIHSHLAVVFGPRRRRRGIRAMRIA